jgi:hypothetical protein
MTRPRPLRLVAALGLGLTLALSPVGEAFARGAGFLVCGLIVVWDSTRDLSKK